MSTLLKRTSGFRKMVIPEVGSEFGRNLIHAFSSAPIATAKFTPQRSFSVKAEMKQRVNSGKPVLNQPILLTQSWLAQHGNPEPSPHGPQAWGKVQRLSARHLPLVIGEEQLVMTNYQLPVTSQGEEIVQALRKRRGIL